MIRKKCVHGRNENEFCSTCSSKHYLNSERAMTATTEPKPVAYMDREPLYSAKTMQQLQRENDRAMREASHLAMSIWRTHYQKESPNFELCDSVAGVISQIDNMYAGLRAELAAAKQQLAEAEKDAQRYRWLRQQHKKHLGLTICNVGMWDLTPWSGDDPDAAIDAAIANQSARDATGCPHLRRTTHKSIIDGSVERDRCADCGEVLSIGVASAAQDQGKGADNERA